MNQQRLYLPEKHRPSSIKKEEKPRPIMYGIGVEHSPNEFGMYHGPVPKIIEMLEIVPQPNSVLIQFGPIFDTVIYRWSDKENAWIREKTQDSMFFLLPLVGVRIPPKGSVTRSSTSSSHKKKPPIHSTLDKSDNWPDAWR